MINRCVPPPIQTGHGLPSMCLFVYLRYSRCFPLFKCFIVNDSNHFYGLLKFSVDLSVLPMLKLGSDIYFLAPRETENNAYAKFWSDQQTVLWYVMVFSRVVNSELRSSGQSHSIYL